MPEVDLRGIPRFGAAKIAWDRLCSAPAWDRGELDPWEFFRAASVRALYVFGRTRKPALV